MRAELYLVPECPAGRLAIMPRPRAGDWLEDETASWRRQSLDVVVSLLEDAEIADLELSAEQSMCERAGLRFLRFPIPDRGVPGSAQAVSELVSSLVAELRNGRGVGIHCRMGIGRSASLAVCVLCALGMPIEKAWAAVQRSRGLTVPDTAEQRAWVGSWFAQFCQI
jgi:protein-tyrosine phosphatase